MKIKLFTSSLLIFGALLLSCNSEDSQVDSSTAGGVSSFTGKYSTETSGYVTWYEGADASSVAYYVPEIEYGWYHYPTSENIKIQVKDGANEWWLAFRFYNMRYPLKKVEFSSDGVNFSEVESLSGIENNWFKVASGENLLSGKHYFRLTDVYGQTVTTSNVGVFSVNGIYDLGKNFGY